MSAIQFFEFSCSCCKSRIAGRKIYPEGVQYSVLYSDGKMICDGYQAEEHKLVSCPACAHLLWLPSVELREKTFDPSSMDQTVYPFSSWYQFGCNTAILEGKVALIEHYQHLLQCIRPINSETEIYLRKQLLWSINDLIRDRSETRFIRLLLGKSKPANWRAGRRRQIRQNLAFLHYHNIHNANLQRLIELLRSNEDRELNRVFLCELYRQKGNFAKCLEMVAQLRRSTHYLSLIEEKARIHNSLVFKVAG
ncbi:MAG TPA: hypothetical protein PKE03_03670 [Bacteroidales bacterium]|nr:hypothetical protein [Bacteroidales bacterium]